MRSTVRVGSIWMPPKWRATSTTESLVGASGGAARSAAATAIRRASSTEITGAGLPLVTGAIRVVTPANLQIGFDGAGGRELTVAQHSEAIKGAGPEDGSATIAAEQPCSRIRRSIAIALHDIDDLSGVGRGRG